MKISPLTNQTIYGCTSITHELIQIKLRNLWVNRS